MPQITTGTVLGSYEITALLGKGGMCAVYRAKDKKLKREVAIKILPDEFSRDCDRVRRFQREAEILAQLNHPNIAAIPTTESSASRLESNESAAVGGGRSDLPLRFDEQLRTKLHAIAVRDQLREVELSSLKVVCVLVHCWDYSAETFMHNIVPQAVDPFNPLRIKDVSLSDFGSAGLTCLLEILDLCEQGFT